MIVTTLSAKRGTSTPIEPGVKNVVAADFVIAMSPNGRWYSDYPAGDRPVDNDEVQNQMYTDFYDGLADTLYYLDPDDGSDSNDGLSMAEAWLTPGHAATNLPAGATLIVKDGVYAAGANGYFNSPENGVTFASGPSWSNPTVIRAETPFGVRFNQATANSGGEIIDPGTSINLMFDGFILNAESAGCDNAVNLRDENGLYRTGIRRADCNAFGGWIDYGTNCNIEDCFAFGYARYGFRTGGPDVGEVSQNNTVRRCIGYMAFTSSEQPKATFACYGSDDANQDTIYTNSWHNCYDIDSPPSGSGPSQPRWGSWYYPKAVRDMRRIGCGIINSGFAFGGSRTDNIGNPNDRLGETNTDCFCVNAQYEPSTTPPAFGGSSGKYNNYSYNASVDDTAQAEFSSNYSGRTFNSAVGTWTYPNVRDGVDGADQLWQIGPFRSRGGDAGFEDPTTRRMWPTPYQSVMATLMAETITKVPGDWPTAISESTNPFATQSFTERVFTSGGAAMPSEAELEEMYS